MQQEDGAEEQQGRRGGGEGGGGEERSRRIKSENHSQRFGKNGIKIILTLKMGAKAPIKGHRSEDWLFTHVEASEWRYVLAPRSDDDSSNKHRIFGGKSR